MATLTRTWWGRRFIEAVERVIDPGRLSRGRSYAHNGRVLDWAIQPGKVVATVRGSINPYFGVYEEPRYKTVIHVPAIEAARWATIIGDIGARASLVTRLLMGEMPDAIEGPFEAAGLHLLPPPKVRFKSSCSCPDYADPCKHVAGLYYVLAAALDRDPFLMFALRGLSRPALQEALRQTPLGAALALDLAETSRELTPDAGLFPAVAAEPAPERVSARAFWQGAARLEGLPPAVTPPGVPALTIKREGDYPPFWEREGSFIEVMEELYGRVRRRLE